MPQFLRTLSDLLESSRATITQDELSALTDDVRDAMLSLKILVPSRTATHVVCDACHEDHVEEVVRIKTGKDVIFRMICPSSGWVDVPTDRLRQWTLDVPRLAEVLANGVNPSGSVETVVTDSAWNLGSMEVAGSAFNVVLFRDRGDSPLASVTKRVPQQRTVIVRTGEATDMVEGFAATLSLPMAFAFNEGRFKLQADQVRGVLVTESAAIGNVFQLRGDKWQLSFDGETQFLNDSAGLHYIACLLREPRRIIPVPILHEMVTGIPADAIKGTSEPYFTTETHQNYRSRLEQLREDRMKAEKNSDSSWLTRIDKETEQIEIELSYNLGLHNNIRERSEYLKVKRKIAEYIRRGKTAVSKRHSVLGLHLDNSIKTRGGFRYESEQEYDWLT